MLSRPFSSSFHSKRLLSLSSSVLFKPANTSPKPQHPSQKTATTFFPFPQIEASLGNPETTHVIDFHLDPYFLSDSLNFSAKNGRLKEGRQLHSCIEKSGCGSQHSIQNQLLNMYLKCGDFVDAHKMFDEMPNRNVVSWNIMISGCVSRSRYPGLVMGEAVKMDFGLCVDMFDEPERKVLSLNGMTSGCVSCDCHLGPTTGEIEKKGLESSNSSSMKLGLFFFKKMLVEMVGPNYITFISVLGACLRLNDIEIGKQLHCLIIKVGFSSNGFVGSALVDLYAKFGNVGDARQVFDKIQSRDLVLWNVMVSCYAFNGLGREAFGVFRSMMLEGIMGDDFTFSSLLSSCSSSGSCQLGKQIHGFIIRLALDLDVLVTSTLVDMYAKNGLTEDARKAFDRMRTRNVVSWTTMIVGYGQNGEGKEAMELFKLMLQEGLKPDELTLASLLSSCSNLAAVNEAVQLHGHVIKNGLGTFMSIGNGLINAYAKCGCIASAFESFSSVSNPDLVTWTSMISAYAFHGLAREALEIFEEMLREGLRPDRVVFVGVLSACSHAGLVDEGFHYFDSMRRDHRIMPDSEHYTCMVDLLGRAGHLERAHSILVNMPYGPTPNALGAFISACRLHGNIRLAKWAAEMLFELEPDEAVNYAVMSNIYAAAGSWRDVARVRKMMRNVSDYKIPGCSWTEIGSKVHTFVSHDKSHPQALEIYAILELLVSLMKLEDST
ncbi:pentatricopeptide repeat-containing protein At2g46050, mitochondrial [Magnolia sinica]|uniref:pentatricopeptide repeat-containing protein At2g46050, mitochondrial n=1 Tax=Magnolia sinica TaxID=86752 RepID=UPI00265A5D79|nr:pentatricopeptide repeat-containing protein At2g46050, mitochondrial [Magnolia sinica]